MRILNVQLKHIHGGNPQACLNYTKMLKLAGHEVSVLMNPADPFIQQNKDCDAEIILSKRLGEFGSYDILTILYFKKIISQLQPDIIIVHEGRSAALMKKAAGKLVPVVDVNHGRSPKQSRFMDATFVINDVQLKNTKAALGAEGLVYAIPNSIELRDEPVFPKSWNDAPVIGTMGRFVKDKALDVFIDAVKILKDKNIRFKVMMGGDGEERSFLEEKISEYGLGDIISIPGWVKNPDEFYKQMDIFCFPSRKEEFGLVLLEAWKHGLPVVVSDAEGPAEIVSDNIDGLVVQKENPEALAKALIDILNDKQMADRFAVAGYRKLQEKYSITKVAKQLNDAIEDVVDKKSRKNKNRNVA